MESLDSPNGGDSTERCEGLMGSFELGGLCTSMETLETIVMSGRE